MGLTLKIGGAQVGQGHPMLGARAARGGVTGATVAYVWMVRETH